jgi:hypothetical protein
MKHLLELITKFEDQKGNDMTEEQYENIELIRQLANIETENDCVETFEQFFCEVDDLED